ncbi:homocysteine S-methyltransferase [Streptococcus panodentis]|uniref:Homocysteine S-methyltransferase n=1 Tax=Streptococcus panodentis TaxID=1581472 RepID=A0ABS5ATH5_9STRE|nr:homocysteine S-methyltransferase [Streptococcus panodentis]MBP2619869.1 homocysteine S-methyltransferase [Streptococcus panodentis]
MGKFNDLLTENEVIILDGALGTELESRGYDVSGKLWSAKYLLDNPQVIQKLHETYVRAGSDIITTSSYQASIPAFTEAGLTAEASYNLLKETVKLARDAIEQVWQELPEQDKTRRPYPLVAGSVGPYAAYLSDGSEYTGAYQLTKEEFQDFHRPRIQALLEAGSDLLAVETIPNGAEAAALLDLLATEFPQAEAYLSFTAQSEEAISDGSRIEEVGAWAQASPQILAVGFNCTAPHLISPLLDRLRQVCSKPLLTYPNSGEIYDGVTQTWHDDPEQGRTLVENSRIWQQQGARLLGGCCRTRPEDIAQLAAYFRSRDS